MADGPSNTAVNRAGMAARCQARCSAAGGAGYRGLWIQRCTIAIVCPRNVRRGVCRAEAGFQPAGRVASRVSGRLTLSVRFFSTVGPARGRCQEGGQADRRHIA